MKIQVMVLRVVTPCGVAVGYQRSGGSCCFHLYPECRKKADVGAAGLAVFPEFCD
jgi:hypothetical protein